VSPIPFVALEDPRYGQSVQVSPLIRRVIAENPSKYTYRGTGTYIVGAGDVAVVDPGPELDAHRQALETALRGERVTAIFVTHCHSDHSPLAHWLHDSTGAPTYAFGPHAQLDSEIDDTIEDGLTREETIDTRFDPDVRVADGAIAASGPGWTVRGVHTPGHTSNHMCFALDEERALFTGDHIMGWSTTVVSPPDGDMRAYMDSVRKLIGRADASLWPTHGAPVTSPQPFLEAYLQHRIEREAQVIAVVGSGVSSIEAMVKVLYADVSEELHRAAARSVLAHLVKLVDDGLVSVEGVPGPKAVYHPA
jgi:glyoxylase-like metal-dependent hydrolase (beta-lactamase superfamily II)